MNIAWYVTYLQRSWLNQTRLLKKRMNAETVDSEEKKSLKFNAQKMPYFINVNTKYLSRV